MAGIRRLKSPKEEKFFQHFFSDVEILDLNLPSAEVAAGIGARMAAAGNRVNAFDILIAGIAIVHHASLIITADAILRRSQTTPALLSGIIEEERQKPVRFF